MQLGELKAELKARAEAAELKDDLEPKVQPGDLKAQLVELKAQAEAEKAKAEAITRILDVLTTSGYKGLRDLADSELKDKKAETITVAKKVGHEMSRGGGTPESERGHPSILWIERVGR